MVKERTKNPYMFFLDEHRKIIKKKNPEFKITDVAKKCGEMWRGLSELKKKKQ